jgi:hypothetical protein
MNVWSAPIVTNANNGRLTFAAAGVACLLALFVLAGLPLPARAQETTAQSLYGIKEILVRPVHFDNATVAASCRLRRDALDAFLMRELQDNNLPVTAEMGSVPSAADIARIYLVPQIVPFNSQGLDCVTWVSLSAESRSHLRVLPIEIPRIVTVVYWRRGELVTSAQSVHADHVTATLHNMIRLFAESYNNAQPPKIGRPTAPTPH